MGAWPTGGGAGQGCGQNASALAVKGHGLLKAFWVLVAVWYILLSSQVDAHLGLLKAVAGWLDERPHQEAS